jgi:hypothetical protein
MAEGRRFVCDECGNDEEMYCLGCAREFKSDQKSELARMAMDRR